MTPMAGDVLFVWGNTFIEKAIEFVTHGPSHCAIFINENELIEAQGGTTIRKISLEEYQNVKTEVWEDPTLTNDDRSKMVEFAESKIGEGYDYFLILLELCHYELGEQIQWYKENKHFICSTFVNKCAESVKKEWSKEFNPAPVGLQEGGELRKKVA